MFKKNFKKRSEYMDNTMYKNERPAQTEGETQIGLAVKAGRNLPKSAYSMQVDPYQDALPEATPYMIINNFNRKIGGSYSGDRNLDGGNVAQYANSLRSGFLQVADFIKVKIAVQYRYIPAVYSSAAINALTLTNDHEFNFTDNDYITRVDQNSNTEAKFKPYMGSGLIDQQRQAIAETASLLAATTFTQMAINNYVIETDLPLGSAKMSILKYGTPGAGEAQQYKVVYTNLTDVIYGCSRFYQIFLQDCLLAISSLNSCRLKEGTMIRSSWNRETPKLNGLFGLLNKKSFLSMLDSICLGFEGEYVDTEWSSQLNTLLSVPSRRANAITEPVVELNAIHAHPTYFRMYLKIDGQISPESKIFDLDDLVYLVNGEPETFHESIKYLIDALSAQSIMRWARNPATPDTFESDTMYFNQVKYRLDAILNALTIFKTSMNDVRETFDVLARTGVNTWKKGFRPSITKDTDAPLFHNMLVEDVVKNIFSGDSELVFDNNTKRWRFFTLWGLYSGIPEYDTYNGGSFLSFSGKDLNASTDPDLTYTFLPAAYVPAGLTFVGSDQFEPTMLAVTRDGLPLTIDRTRIIIREDDSLARLAPLPSQYLEEMFVPRLDLSELSGITDPSKKRQYISHMQHTLTTLFSVCKIGMDVYLNPDLVAIYQIEVNDITNYAISYARANGPFRGSTQYDDIIGFSKFGQN